MITHSFCVKPGQGNWAEGLGDINASAAGKHWIAQHPARGAEYAGAFVALADHLGWSGSEGLVLDVGGAGSPLPWMIARRFGLPVQVIDPGFNGLAVGVAQDPTRHFLNAATGPLLGKADFISCISVIEHVPDEEAFLVDLTNLLAPGGVLFLTTDYVDEALQGDIFQFHWMRQRIYTKESWFYNTLGRLLNLGCTLFGGLDKTYHGPIADLGYTFASLCVRKEESK